MVSVSEHHFENVCLLTLSFEYLKSHPMNLNQLPSKFLQLVLIVYSPFRTQLYEIPREQGRVGEGVEEGISEV